MRSFTNLRSDVSALVEPCNTISTYYGGPRSDDMCSAILCLSLLCVMLEASLQSLRAALLLRVQSIPCAAAAIVRHPRPATSVPAV